MDFGFIEAPETISECPHCFSRYLGDKHTKEDCIERLVRQRSELMYLVREMRQIMELLVGKKI